MPTSFTPIAAYDGRQCRFLSPSSTRLSDSACGGANTAPSGHPACLPRELSPGPSGGGAIAPPGCRQGMAEGLSAALSWGALGGRDIACSPDPASRDHSLVKPRGRRLAAV